MIELQQVEIRVGAFFLKNISFRVEVGEHAVLMGQTGRGKTTILETICGLKRVSSGTIRVRDQDITDWLPGDRAIGYVPQDLALFPTLSVRQHLEFALKLRRQPSAVIRERVEELAELLGIVALLPRAVTGLSGGEAQRVALGRALSFHPSVLLLDEPFSALDESTRSEMHALLQSVTRQTRITTLHVTHSRQEADALADRLFLLCDGAVAEERQKAEAQLQPIRKKESCEGNDSV
ncbi:MAG: ABC transporter ATP-binding protein [Fuerstiella sp.]